MLDINQTSGQYQLLIFDWDGTIADSLQLIVNAIRLAIDKADFPERDDEAIKAIIGLGLEEALVHLFHGINGAQLNSMAVHYRESYRIASTRGINLFPHVKESIKLLNRNGHDLAVATGKSRRGLDRALRDSGMQGYFHYSRCADETFSKPHPQMLKDIMENFATEPDRALMIGDSEHDLQMAANAGVASVAVTYGAQSREKLQKFNPVTCIDNLWELPQWLAKHA